MPVSRKWPALPHEPTDRHLVRPAAEDHHAVPDLHHPYPADRDITDEPPAARDALHARVDEVLLPTGTRTARQLPPHPRMPAGAGRDARPADRPAPDPYRVVIPRAGR